MRQSRRSLAWVLSVLLLAGCALAQDDAADAAESSDAQDDEVCPSDGSGPASCRGGAAEEEAAAQQQPVFTLTRSVSTARVPYTGPQADLITQEIDELQSIINLSTERVGLLKDLREALGSGHEVLLPGNSNIKALHEKLPILSEVVADDLRTPAAASEDYLVSKAVIPFDEQFEFLQWMPLRSPRSSTAASTQTSMPNTLLAAVRQNGDVHLLTPSGDLALAFRAGHDAPVTHVAVPSSQEEYLLATCDASGVIRVHKVNVRQRRLDKKAKSARRGNSSVEKISQHLGSMINVTVQLQKQMKLPDDGTGEASKVTTVAMVSQGSTKYLLAGDASGKITVFTRNGTVRSVLDTAEGIGGGVDSLYAVHGSVMYRSGQDWGYIDLERMELRHVDCPMFNGRVMDAVLDSQLASRVLVTDEDGTVWVFSVKNKKQCHLDLKFANGTTLWPLSLHSVRGYAIGLERGPEPALFALNMSQVGKSKPAAPGPKGADAVPVPPPPPPAKPIVWRRGRSAAKAWSLHRRAKEGDLLAFLSEDGHEIEIMELLMNVYTPLPQDQFGNFKMPVIAVAVVLVLGYQYMKNKGGRGSPIQGGGGRGGKLDLGGDTDFASMLRNKKRLTNLKSKKPF